MANEPRVLSCPQHWARAAAPFQVELCSEGVEAGGEQAQLGLFQAGSSGKSSGSRAWTRQMGQVLECCLSHVRMHCGDKDRDRDRDRSQAKRGRRSPAGGWK